MQDINEDNMVVYSLVDWKYGDETIELSFIMSIICSWK